MPQERVGLCRRAGLRHALHGDAATVDEQRKRALGSIEHRSDSRRRLQRTLDGRTQIGLGELTDNVDGDPQVVHPRGHVTVQSGRPVHHRRGSEPGTAQVLAHGRIDSVATLFRNGVDDRAGCGVDDAAAFCRCARWQVTRVPQVARRGVFGGESHGEVILYFGGSGAPCRRSKEADPRRTSISVFTAAN